MSDEEYLEYLHSKDILRDEQAKIIADEEKQAKIKYKEQAKINAEEEKLKKLKSKEIARTNANYEKQKRIENKEIEKQKIEDKIKTISIGNNFYLIIKNVAKIILLTIAWITSIFCLILSFTAFNMNGGIASGIAFLTVALVINPFIYKVICNYILKVPRWVCVIIFFVGFIISLMLFPTANNEEVVKSLSFFAVNLTV